MIVQKAKTWFLSIDKTLIVLILLLSLIGSLLVLSSSGVIAGKLKLPSMFFIKKHLINLLLGFSTLLFISVLNENWLRKIALMCFVFFLLLVAITNIVGAEIKGSTRWINILGFNLQPSEFLKPFYIVVLSRILSFRNSVNANELAAPATIGTRRFKKSLSTLKKTGKRNLTRVSNFPAYKLAIAIHAVVVLLLLKQPDLGMAVTYTVIFICLIFLSGISLYWLPIAGGLLISVVGVAYKYLPHVSHRINSFLYSGGKANYQVEKSIDSYVSGGIFGQGPLGGNVKHYLPDCHTDFIFAVAAEELGAVFASLIIILILFITIRILVHSLRATDMFKFYTISGIAILYAFQSIFNIGVTLNLLPTKGMTLPFVSYGGSSTISFMIAFGILLNFTKKNFARLNIKNKALDECILED